MSHKQPACHESLHDVPSLGSMLYASKSQALGCSMLLTSCMPVDRIIQKRSGGCVSNGWRAAPDEVTTSGAAVARDDVSRGNLFNRLSASDSQGLPGPADQFAGVSFNKSWGLEGISVTTCHAHDYLPRA
eukprot:355292-Chlamydomonas_euryale.AAC.14